MGQNHPFNCQREEREISLQTEEYADYNLNYIKIKQYMQKSILNKNKQARTKKIIKLQKVECDDNYISQQSTNYYSNQPYRSSSLYQQSSSIYQTPRKSEKQEPQQQDNYNPNDENKLYQLKQNIGYQRVQETPPQGSPAQVYEVYTDGCIYSGIKIDQFKHGQGEYIFKDKTVYKGNWVKNKMQGKGKLFYPDMQLMYEGYFTDNMFDGQGTLYNCFIDKTLSDHDNIYYYNFDKLGDKWIKYEGEFSQGMKQGKGRFYISNGDLVYAEFQNDQINGEGILYQKNLVQTYRNMSRHCKQYFLGDKQLEEIFILGLRSFFYIPYDSICPTDMIKHGGERRFVDQYDRDFELMSYNSHPYQLFAYQTRNEHLEWKNQQYQQIQKGEKTFEQEVLDHLDQLVDAERAKLRQGQSFSVERMAEIALHVFRQARAGQSRPSQDSRGPDGNVNDYLEARRPFAQPNLQGVTH